MKVKITLKKSIIGEKPKAKETVRSLGLKKINSYTERELKDRKSTRLNSSHVRTSRMPSSA